MRKLIPIATPFLCGALLLSSPPPREQDVFLEKPYLQIGDAPSLSGADSMMVLWQTGQNTPDWKVEVRTAKDKSWRAAGQPTSQVLSAPAGQPAIAGQNGAKKDAPVPPAIDPHIVYRARLTNLVPGEDFQYRVLRDGFSADQNQGWTAEYNFGSRQAALVRWNALIAAHADFIATDEYEDVAQVIRGKQ